jgi:MFS family permease
MLLASLAPDVWLALAGFAATGLGLANLFPAAIARAGRLAGSAGVALTSLLGYSGFLLGPPAIGFLASQAGLRTGLTTLSFLGLAAAAIAYLSRDQPRLHDREQFWALLGLLHIWVSRLPGVIAGRIGLWHTSSSRLTVTPRCFCPITCSTGCRRGMLSGS